MGGRARRAAKLAASIGVGIIAATPAFAQTPAISAADTAWMIVATALVLMMTIPGLALFYSGMVRRRTCWRRWRRASRRSPLFRFSGRVRLLAGLCRRRTVARNARSPVPRGHDHGQRHPAAKTIPEALFMLYQMTFAIITVALVAGSVADRIRFSAYLLFSIGWFVFVYVPLAHWIWGGGFLGSIGVLDFAGGLVVHLSAGIGGPGRGKGPGTAPRLWQRESVAVRSVARGGRHRLVVGRLVRLQRGDRRWARIRTR